MKPWEEWTQVYRPQILANKNGIRSKEIDTESKQIKKKELKESYWSNNFHQQVLRQLPYPDLIHICHQISVSFFKVYIIFIEIPKPYGVFSPFMPSEPGASMRHITKPKIREIEYWLYF